MSGNPGESWEIADLLLKIKPRHLRHYSCFMPNRKRKQENNDYGNACERDLQAVDEQARPTDEENDSRWRRDPQHLIRTVLTEEPRRPLSNDENQICDAPREQKVAIVCQKNFSSAPNDSAFEQRNCANQERNREQPKLESGRKADEIPAKDRSKCSHDSFRKIRQSAPRWRHQAAFGHKVVSQNGAGDEREGKSVKAAILNPP